MTVTVLRDGRNACDSRSMSGLARQDLVRLMIGRSEQIPDWRKRDESRRRSRARIARSSRPRSATRASNLTLRKAEIVGLYGLVGAGRTELAKCVLGLNRLTAGALLIDGQKAVIGSVAEAITAIGIGYVSEDRKQEGLILMHSVLDNAGITIWKRARRKARSSDRQSGQDGRRAAHRKARSSYALAQHRSSATCRAAISKRSAWRSGSRLASGS